ncbi:unnamed protein product [Phytophthora lilii]|uniref:Unnamed protein product n=1 Tax=Phytophthora lilii TaxID=2077276 RepID=A0A9W6WNJ0_9STRA|nr:unnamed protein product [Phytophthora lilii]
MPVDAAATILADVTAAAELLGRAEASSTAIGDLDHLLQALQRIVADLGSQRVLQLSSTQLMNAGVELYNAPRAALKVLVQTEKSKEKEDEQPASFPRYLLALTRFVAAKIMGLSLVCSKGGSEENVKQNMHFVDEYVDVLRSFGRVGMLMLESASIDCEKCEQYLLLAKEAFASSLQLWSRIGLSHLTKTKQDLELEDVVDDLWDFCVDRVRVLQLLAKGSDMVEEFQDIVSTLHELKMLAPYKPSYGSILLDLMTSVSDGYAQTAQHELQVRFAEEVLHTSESLRNDADTNFLSIVTVFKQHILLNLLGSLCAIGDIKRAETCFQHVPDNQDPKALLLIINLYVENKQFEKAHRLLLVLFQQDNLDDAILGARSYAKGLSYSERGMEIYRELVHNYGDASVTISLAIACDFALHENKVYRLRAVEEIKRLGLLLERYEEANVWARKAFSVEPSKQSFFATFRVALHTDSMDNQEELLHMMEQLKARDDFELQDLFAMGKLVSDLGSTRQDILLHILDELCRAFVQTDDCLADVPTLLVLQNAAQLSFSNISQLPAGQDADPDNSFSDKFLEYTSALLQLSRPDILKDKHSVGSSSVFEWFFRMRFDMAYFRLALKSLI